jgi:hypothetical protein
MIVVDNDQISVFFHQHLEAGRIAHLEAERILKQSAS